MSSSIAPLAKVKARVSAYVDECGADGPNVITRNGKAVAVLLVPDDDDDLERLLLERAALSCDARPFQAKHQVRRWSIRGGFLEGCAKTSAGAKGSGRGKSRDQMLRAEPSGRLPMILKQPVE